MLVGNISDFLFLHCSGLYYKVDEIFSFICFTFLVPAFSVVSCFTVLLTVSKLNVSPKTVALLKMCFIMHSSFFVECG